MSSFIQNAGYNLLTSKIAWTAAGSYVGYLAKKTREGAIFGAILGFTAGFGVETYEKFKEVSKELKKIKVRDIETSDKLKNYLFLENTNFETLAKNMITPDNLEARANLGNKISQEKLNENLLENFSHKTTINAGLTPEILAQVLNHLSGIPKETYSYHWAVFKSKEMFQHLLKETNPFLTDNIQNRWSGLPWMPIQNGKVSIRQFTMAVLISHHYVYLSVVGIRPKGKAPHYNIIYVDSLGRPLIEKERNRLPDIEIKDLIKLLPKDIAPGGFTCSFEQITPEYHQINSIVFYNEKEKTTGRNNGNRCGYYVLRYDQLIRKFLASTKVNFKTGKLESELLRNIFHAKKTNHVGQTEIDQDIDKIHELLKNKFAKKSERKSNASQKISLKLSDPVKVPQELMNYDKPDLSKFMF